MIPIEERCQEEVHDGGRSVSFHRCSRRAVKDGYCKMHHPDAIKKKREKEHALWDQDSKVDLLVWSLRDLCADCVELVKELGQFGQVGSSIIIAKCAKLAGTINALEETIKEERKKLEEMKEK